MHASDRVLNRVLTCFGLAVLVAFAWFVWPTPWREWVVNYPHVNGLGHHYSTHVHYRVNVFTGERQWGYSGMLGMVDWHREHSHR